MRLLYIIILLIISLILYLFNINENFLPEAVFPADPSKKPIFSPNNQSPMTLISSPNNMQTIQPKTTQYVVSNIDSSLGKSDKKVSTENLLASNIEVKQTASTQINEVKKPEVISTQKKIDFEKERPIYIPLKDENKEDHGREQGIITYMKRDLLGDVYKGYNYDNFWMYAGLDNIGVIDFQTVQTMKPQGVNYIYD